MNGTLKIVLMVVLGVVAVSLAFSLAGMAIKFAVFTLFAYVVFRVAKSYMANKK